MPTFAEKARQAQQEKRARDEKDPADLSGAQKPDWDNPETWGGSGSGAGDSASGNDGGSDSGTEGQEPPAAEGAGAPPKPARRSPRRAGRPRGPERAPLSVRVLAANDRMLTLAVEQTGKNPQTLVDEALGLLFRKLKIEDPGEQAQQADDVA
ncbi:hypothetical protein [Streptomyces sp. NBC_01373]|uniref:hypothetical protein n=1 Tax=Streptomyces sp. NBC_01373 TaxID=2903843 RepID=UPI00224DB2A5|nr:hypothetical protein [Streptomyces sp. NBC_01373]MCX4707206.1 hypothetical protein [Streptomyces sp. NBC_01373]